MRTSFGFNEKLVFHNNKGQSLEISVTSPFFLQSADGIDSLENEFYNVKNYNEDGTNVKGSSVRERNIVVGGQLRRQEKEINRQKMIRFFNPKHRFTLEYTDGVITRFIDCRVEKSPVITKHIWPEFMISFLCPNPWWYTEEQKYEIAMWIPTFEFELEIDEAKGIEMGYREPSNIVNVFNDSDTASPLRIQFKALGTVINPYIEVIETGRMVKIEATLQGGDIVTVNTKRGDEYAILERNGSQINYFNFLSYDSDIQLSVDVGDNLIRYDAAEYVSNLEVSIYFTPQFVGV